VLSLIATAFMTDYTGKDIGGEYQPATAVRQQLKVVQKEQIISGNPSNKVF
jgi:hypothetical protein